MGIDENLEKDTIKSVCKNNFNGSMKARFVPNVVFEEGDILIFPKEYSEANIFDITFGNDDISAECVIVMLKRKKAEQSIKFFPNILQKVIFPSHKEGDEVIDDRPVNTSGTAAFDYQACYGKLGDNGKNEYASDVAYAMSKFKGKRVVISTVREFETRVWKNGERTDQLRKTYLYEFNWANTSKKRSKK